MSLIKEASRSRLKRKWINRVRDTYTNEISKAEQEKEVEEEKRKKESEQNKSETNKPKGEKPITSLHLEAQEALENGKQEHESNT